MPDLTRSDPTAGGSERCVSPGCREPGAVEVHGARVCPGCAAARRQARAQAERLRRARARAQARERGEPPGPPGRPRLGGGPLLVTLDAPGEAEVLARRPGPGEHETVDRVSGAGLVRRGLRAAARERRARELGATCACDPCRALRGA